MAWATLVQARANWADAESLTDSVLTDLLDAATVACYAYAPKLSDKIAIDGVTINGVPEVTSVTTAFEQADIGRVIEGAGIPNGSTIVSVVSASKVVISDPATTDGIGVTITISGTPTHYMLACIMQAKEIRAAALREGDIIGIGDYAIRSRPLTATVKSLLRPESRVMVIG